jgi:glucuronosyltransferase
MRRIVFVTLLLINLSVVSGTGKILALFTAPFESHNAVHRAFINELVEREHEVVVVTPDVEHPEDDGPENLKEINIHNITYNAIKEELMKLKIGHGESMYSHFNEQYRLINILAEKLVRSKRIKKALEDKYDVIIIDATHEVLLAVSNVLKVPVIQMSSFGSTNGFETVGAPINPLLYPEIITQRLQNLTIMEEIKELLVYLSLRFMHGKAESKIDNMLKKKVPESPLIKDLRNNISTLFLNTNPIWEENRPVPTGVVYTMGLPRPKSKELPEVIVTNNNKTHYCT